MTDSRALLLAGSGLLALAACDRNGRDLLPPIAEGFEAVEEYGEVQVLSRDDWDEFTSLPADERQDWCAEEDDEGRRRCLYPSLRTPDVGKKGGATFTFEGTGGWVCVIADPESVFWNQSIAAAGVVEQYAYPDYYNDDGDVDLFAGLSSYYTGSPGVELGDFTGIYTDSAGRQIEIEYGECSQVGAQGQTDAHAGRGTQEYCDINTDEREGVGYTVVAETFSVPLDDGILSYGAMAVGARCNQLNITECSIKGESLTEDGDVRDCSVAMEEAYCAGQQLGFCCANPDMCYENPPDGICDDYEFDRDAFCSANPSYCCD